MAEKNKTYTKEWILEKEEVMYVNGTIASRTYHCSYHILNRKIKFTLHTVGSNCNRSVQLFTDGGVVPQLTLDFLKKFTEAAGTFLREKGY